MASRFANRTAPPRRVLPLLLVAAAALRAGAAAPVDFVRDVRPILQSRCHECHGAEKQKSGLRLDLKADALKGGDNHAPDIIPHRADTSPLLQLVASGDPEKRMPPKGPGLSAVEIATLKAWVEQGAIWPDGVDTARKENPRDHWAFKPLTRPPLPPVATASWTRGAIDHFVLAKLDQAGLKPSPEADRATWLRRVTFDLTGLPPSPEEAAAFATDTTRDARERVVDRLLKSPRYGERWAQHWLDVVRYADTHGFEVNTERPNAWPYRDYVIRAFNQDTPYDRFIREQIAGDAMGEDAATGFLVTASVLLPGQIGKDEPSMRLARQDSLDEIVMNIGQTFLGLSVGCARCHDHKFDPVLQRDYYAMQAFVAGVEYLDRDLRTPDAEAARREADSARARVAELDRQLARFVPLAGAGGERPMINARMNTDRFAPVQARRIRFTIESTNSLEPCLDELEAFTPDGTNVALASAGAIATASGSTTVADRHDLKHINDGLYGNSRSWMSNEKGKGWVAIEFSDNHTIDRVVWGRDRQEKFKDRLPISYRIEVAAADGPWRTVASSADRMKFDPEGKKRPAFSSKGLTAAEAAEAARLMEEKRPLEARIAAATAAQKVFAGTFRKPDEIHLLARGDPEQPKEEIAPAVPAVFGDVRLPRDAPEADRRRFLADWIARPDNPLTARVMVNRIWQGHFGTGIVETPSDFGRNGARPSHPELLDWLAREFIESGWSLKRLHKLIVLSATYRQASSFEAPADSRGQAATPPMSGAQIDADDRLLWRYPSRRLEAEAIRDAMLAASGRLNLTMYGRGFDLFDKRGGLTGFNPVESYASAGLRRMIYAHKVRREREAVFGSFDCPDAGQSTARRRESTTAIQALNLFNSRFTIDEAAALAARVRREAGPDPAAQIRRAYELVLGRSPSPEEMNETAAAVRGSGLEALGRALFNCNEFLFLP